MPYNNLETQVTSVSYTWSGSAVSFSTLGLSTSIPFKDQIEVERIFSSAGFNAVKDTITPKDLHKIFLLEKTEYTITGNTVSGFSGLTGSRVYTLTDGTSRTVTIPAISNGDSIIIRRKTLSMDTYVTWAPGTKLTTTQLNQQVGQLLRLNQELIYKLDTEYVRASDLTGTTAPITSLNNSLNMNSNTINNLGNFSSTVGDGNNSYAVNKGYIDTNFVNRSTAQTGIAGAKTFTGAITLSSTLAVTGAVTLSSGLTVDTNTLVVDATNDRVGIGTTSPSQKLHVNAGTIRVDNTDSNGTSLISTGTGASGSNFQVAHKTTSYVTVLNSGGGIAFETNSTGEKMRIEPGGNLILGNATSAGDTTRNLDIYNSTNGTSAASIIRLITNNTSGAASAIGQIVKYQTGAFAIQNTDVGATAHIRLDVGNSERMRIDSAGRVGIGAASAGIKLTVTTTGVGSDGIQVINSDNSAYGSLHAQGTTGGIASWANGFVIEGVPASTGNTILSSYTGALSFQTARAERMRINSSGALLHGGTEIGNTGTISLVPGGSSPFNNKLVFGTDGTGYKFAIASQQGANASVNRLVIQDNGNVGIATDSPTTKLAVNGTTSISGITTLSSTEASTNTTSGALQVGGGVGITENLYVGGYIDATLSVNTGTLFSAICNASQAIQAGKFNVTSTSGATTCGSLTLGSVAGAYTVTQATSKTTGVTLNKVSGQITMSNAALASNASVVFVFTNSTIVENASTTSVVAVNHCSTSGGTDGAYAIQTLSTANGTCRIRVTNISAGSLSEALAINFVVLNGNKVTIS